MFQKLVLILSFVVFGFHSNAQNPVKWSIRTEKAETEVDTYLIVFRAKITDTWHLYSQHLPSPDAGPVPTQFAFDVNENIELIGKVTEDKDKMHSVMDAAFGVQVNYYDGEVAFTQKVKISSDLATLSGFVYYMVCSDIMCIPKDMEFNLVFGR